MAYAPVLILFQISNRTISYEQVVRFDPVHDQKQIIRRREIRFKKFFFDHFSDILLFQIFMIESLFRRRQDEQKLSTS